MDIAEEPSAGPVLLGQISPTDISQFVRLEQCQRYLRLRLDERARGRRFLYDYGVKPQSIPPLLTRSGAGFEQLVEAQVRGYCPTHRFADSGPKRRADDNAEVLRFILGLEAGKTLVLLQPRLQVDLGAWRIRGDVDLLRLERDGNGALRVLIADMKSSTSAKVEHRLQVAFYVEMLDTLLRDAGVPVAAIEMGVLYRGPADPLIAATPVQLEAAARQREAALRLFGFEDGLLELVEDMDPYLGSVRDLVTGPGSRAQRIAEAEFDDLFFHLSYKCDGCLYNEFCMKRAAERDDLSLLPHLTAPEKTALQNRGVSTVRELATLKELPPHAAGAPVPELIVTAEKEPLVALVAATWPVGPRLDELIHRARRYRRYKRDQIEALNFIPSKGYGSLPYCDADHNPNLVRIYVDAQHDYLHDRIYLVGALVVGSENGNEPEARRRSLVHSTDGPPDTLAKERELFISFARDLIQAITEVAAPDEQGQSHAPLHLIFYNRFEQQLLLAGLARHLTSILAAAPLYDFVTQLAAFDSPVMSFLDQEIRELKNYPMVCQSLQSVASWLKFDWNQPQPYREIFRARLFDYWSKRDWEPRDHGESLWFTGRARFNSQIPLEYAYAAWGELAPLAFRRDEFAPYRAATVDLLRGFQARRLEAMEHIAKDFSGNRQTVKSIFALPDLAQFQGKAATLAQALDEFITIERHTDLAAWKSARLAPPERRALSGQTLILEYHEQDQPAEVIARNRENQRRAALREQYVAASADGKLTTAQNKEVKKDQTGMRVRLRLSADGVDCGIDELLALTTLRAGERAVLMPRLTKDTRPGASAEAFTPTPKQLLYGTGAQVISITSSGGADGHGAAALVEIEMNERHGARDGRGFSFNSMDEPLRDGERYTLDDDPNDSYGSFCLKVIDGLNAGQHNVLYERLAAPAAGPVEWPADAAAGQRRFLDGLDACLEAGELHPFEPSKRAYIGGHGAAPILLVQGPPGTGKSYCTAFALFARIQGAMAAGREFRAFLTCKTHAATDVLLENVAQVQQLLAGLQQRQPELFARFFDARLLAVPLYRLHRDAPAAGIITLRRKTELPKGAATAAEIIQRDPWCVVGAAPAGTYRMLLDRWSKLFGHPICDCLVLDEASQMNLPEAIMAALPLKDTGQVIVVGDHRQMPPIVKHDWAGEPRRTFQEFRGYESLFLTLLTRGLPLIQFAESFRLHADMAEFLRKEIYVKDGIAFHSRRQQVLPRHAPADPFVAAVLRPEQTIVVVLHDEERSMLRNPFEQTLIAAIAETLALAPYSLDAERGLGVVVPHRAQRAALQLDVPCLNILDPLTGKVVRSAVDTVERFQGDERSAILVGATESDAQYLLVSSEFLLDPRRLTVALSRAKHKLILVAARSIFSLFSADEETFENAQLWKNLLRRTCTVLLWAGERQGQQVEVWGNASSGPSVNVSTASAE